MIFKPEIFKMYDIRGVYGVDIDREGVNRLGQAFGTYFLANGVSEAVVGRDNRVSGGEFKESFIQGLISTGVNVRDVDLITTPMIYFSWIHLDANATVMITASHNPPEYNGLKSALNKKPIFGEAYQKIIEILNSGNFATGKGSVSKYNLWPGYLAEITKNIKLGRKLKVVVDSGNGTTGLFVKELFESLGCEVFGLYLESDGSFPNHQPYPQKVDLYPELIEAIKVNHADIGFAFDGDGDRIGIYNEKGEFIANDILTIIFIREILKNNPNAKIVMNVSTSLSVIEDTKEKGGELVLWKTGYPLISSKMKEVGAKFGGEISGHFFFADRYYGFDDAFYAAVRLIEILSNHDGSMSSLFTNIPQFLTTPEFRLPIIEQESRTKFSIITTIAEKIRKEYPDAEIIDFDGVRFSFPDGWGLIRASNTEPMLTGRAEAKTADKLEMIKKLIADKLQEEGLTLDWNNPISEHK